MDAGFLERLLGGSRLWTGPCVVILDAAFNVDSTGPDSIVTGGQKAYAPRVPTGRLEADTVLLLKDEGVILAIEQHHQKDGMGQMRVKQRLTVVDVRHVVGFEFDGAEPLAVLGVGAPPPVRDSEYRPGTLVG